MAAPAPKTVSRLQDLDQAKSARKTVPSAFSSGTQCAGHGRTARVDESAVGRAQDGAELGARQSNLLFPVRTQQEKKFEDLVVAVV
jgi:hypothetical protein